MKAKGEIARRAFLRRAGLAAAIPIGSSVVHLEAAQAMTTPTALRLDELTCDHFVPLVGSAVAIRGDSTVSLRVRLVEARELGTKASGLSPGRAPFSLIFEGPRGPRVGQETFQVTFESLGTFALFLVPIGRPARVARYQAVFG